VRAPSRTARRPTPVVAVVTALAILTSGEARRSQGPAVDPFAFVAPWVQVSADERRRLDRGEVVARALAASGSQVAVFVATRVAAAPESLAAWARTIEAFKRSPAVLAIGRFSEPPVLSDVDALSLDQTDIDDALDCRLGDCGLKLTAPEIATLRAATPAAGSGRRDAVQVAFRQIVLDRVHAYRTEGMANLPALSDGETPRRLADALSGLLDRSPYLARLPATAEWLRRFPRAKGPEATLFYWSKESYGSGKPVISVTHVGIHRPEPAADRPAVLVTGTQLLATHYTNASLGLTMMVAGLGGGPTYLVYLNRSELDVLNGMLGGMVRATMQRRLARQAPLLIRGLRSRLESGPPPPADR
jgi:hypothetical protein